MGIDQVANGSTGVKIAAKFLLNFLEMLEHLGTVGKKGAAACKLGLFVGEQSVEVAREEAYKHIMKKIGKYGTMDLEFGKLIEAVGRTVTYILRRDIIRKNH